MPERITALQEYQSRRLYAKESPVKIDKLIFDMIIFDIIVSFSILVGVDTQFSIRVECIEYRSRYYNISLIHRIGHLIGIHIHMFQLHSVLNMGTDQLFVANL